MPNRRRTTIALLCAVALAGVLSACSGKAATPVASGSPAASAQPTAPASSTRPAAVAPTCTEIRSATVRGLIDPYYSFGDPGATLVDGGWSGDGGLVLAVQQPCATGDLGGELGNVTVGTIMNSVTGTTGRIWNVMLCSTVKAQVRCVVHFALGDRDPIESVAVADRKLTLVYLTRSDGSDPAVLTLRRTAVYATDGTILKEQSHTDAPYTSA
jgi:hypothetical protein